MTQEPTRTTPSGWLFELDDLSRADAQVAGAKAAYLGDLCQAGFNVPPGFALGLGAYELFLDKSGLGRRITRLLEPFQADPDDPADLSDFEEMARKLRGSFEGAAMPEDLAGPICDRYNLMNPPAGEDQMPVAVRSSGTVSHPGQYDTFLSVRGRSGLQTHIIRVWASTFNAASLVQRARSGLPLDRGPIGVVIHPMVDASAAGVMFTLNPVNGDPSQIVIEGIVGLGDSLVAGEADPDRWSVDKVLLEVTSRHHHAQDQSPCVDDPEILELARVGKLMESHFGAAQDIEWALDRNQPQAERLVLLQSRPERVWGARRPRRQLKADNWADLICSQFKPNEDGN